MNDADFAQAISSLDEHDRAEVASSVDESLALALALHRVVHSVREILMTGDRETLSSMLHEFDHIADQHEGRRIVRAAVLALVNVCDTDDDTAVALDVDELFMDTLKLA